MFFFLDVVGFLYFDDLGFDVDWWCFDDFGVFLYYGFFVFDGGFLVGVVIGLGGEEVVYLE